MEKRLEENARLEKEQMRKDKMELLADRRSKQIEVKKIEQKVNRIKAVCWKYLVHYGYFIRNIKFQLEDWEKQELHLVNFIRTSAKPQIFYCPKVHTPETLKLLEASKEFVESKSPAAFVV